MDASVGLVDEAGGTVVADGYQVEPRVVVRGAHGQHDIDSGVDSGCKTAVEVVDVA